jgi:NitT/TauT family transport system substrate-binding protein
MTRIKWWVWFAFMALAACAPTPGAVPSTALPATIRVGYFPNITHSQALIGIANGAFQQALGSRVQIAPKIFNAGPSEIEALFAGEIDLGYIGPNPAINGYVKSKGQALRIVAGATSAGAALVVRSDAGISSAADLAGKRIATPELGNTQDVAARYYISANGLKLSEKGGNVTLLPAKNADIFTLFLKKEIDAAWVPEPWAAQLIREAGGKVLVDEGTLWPDGKFVTAHLIASGKFLKSNPELVKQWLAAHVQVTLWIRANPENARKIANKELERLMGNGLAADVLDDAWQRMEVTYDPISTSLFKSADRAFNLGFLGKDKPDLSGIYDLTLLNEVLEEKNLQIVQ